MEWLSNITFTIYSVGDGLFMSTVLNAIAALSNSGFFQSLGLLGMMLGLLLIGFNGLATGKAEFQNIFISLILFSLMFGGKADVVIEDIGFAPGEYTENVYTVDNVPFGIATMGWLVSNVSYGITDRLEQAYGSPVNSVGNTSSVGFGRSLDWLSAIKFAKDTNSGCTETTLRYCYWRKNLTHFIAQCTSRAVATDPGKNATRRVTADTFSTDGIGYNSAFDMVPWQDLTTGAESSKTCQDATADLKDYATSGDFTDDYARNVASRIGFGGVNTPSQELLDSFDAMGMDPTVAANFMANIIIDEQMKIATTGVAIADTNSLVNHAMVTNAASQRADKLGGEESLFKLMMRPLMAFFESFIYIASPFMALVIGFGSKGYGMIIKYALTTLWVALWMPTLSAINLFQNTMLERALSQFNVNGNADVGFNNINSLNGSQAAYEQIISWVATGSTLAAATPAITMMLIYGTSQAATSLAASTSGAGFVNEKMTSPDIANTPSVLNRGSEMSQTAATEWKTGGSTMGSFSVGAAAKNVAAASRTQLDTAMQSWTSAGSSAVSQAFTNEVGSRSSAIDRAGLDNKMENYGVRELARQAGVSTEGMSSTDLGLAMSMIDRVGADGKLGIGASKGVNAAVGGSASTESREEQSQKASRIIKAAEQMATHARGNEGFRVSAASTVANIAENMSYDSNATRSTAENRQALTNAKQATSQASNAYQTMKSAESMAGYTQNVPNDELANKIKSTPGMSEKLASLVSQTPGGLDTARGLGQGSHVQTDAKTSLALGAMIGLATGQIKADGGSGAGLAEVAGILKSMNYGGGDIGSGGVSNTSGAGSAAPNAEQVKAEVGGGSEASFNPAATEAKAKSGGFTVGTGGADAARANVAANVPTINGGTQIDQGALEKTDGVQAFNAKADSALQSTASSNNEKQFAHQFRAMTDAGEISPASGNEFFGMARNGSGATVSQAMGLAPGAVDANAYSGSFDNLKADYMSGKGPGSMGTPLNESAATVMAANAAVRGGEQLSPEQQAEVRSADRAMSDTGRTATRFVANSVSFGGDGVQQMDPAKVAPAISAISGAPSITPNDRIDPGQGKGGGSAVGQQGDTTDFRGNSNIRSIPEDQQDAFYGTNPEVSGGGPQSNLDKKQD